MANTGPRPEAISLQWVLGANSAAVFALHAAPGSLAGQRIFYISGNVGVIYDAGAKTQTLLRGHVSVVTLCAHSDQNIALQVRPRCTSVQALQLT